MSPHTGCLLLRKLQIWNLLYHAVDIVQRVRHCGLLCRIDNLLHSLGNLFLKIHGIKALRVHVHLWDRHRLMSILTRALHFLNIDMRIAVLCLTERAILLFLRLSQRLIKHLELQRPLHIRTVAKPEYQLVTGIDTLVAHPRLVIEISQFICPFFRILLLPQLFQNRNQLPV